MEEDLHELKSKSSELNSNQFRNILITCLPDHMRVIEVVCLIVNKHKE